MRIVLDLGTSWVWTRPPVGIVRTERKFAQFLLSRPDLDVAFCRFDKAVEHHVPIAREEVQRLVQPPTPSPIVGAEADAGKNSDDEETTVDVSATDAERDADEAGARDVAPAGVDQRTDPGNVTAVGRAVREASRDASGKPPRRAFGSLRRGSHALLARLPATARQEAVETIRHGIEFVKGSGRLAARIVRSARPVAALPVESEAVEVKVEPPETFQFTPDDVYLSMGLDWDFNNVVEIYRQRRVIGFKTVLFCYDTIPIKFPHYMTFDTRHMFSRYFVDVSHTADCVVAISRTSRDDLIELLAEVDAPQPVVEVIVLGTDLDAPKADIRPPCDDLEDEPFVLCVSTIETRKNHLVLYQVWNRLAERYGKRTPRLVIVGMMGWGTQDLIFRMQTNPLTKDHITILDKLPDGELAWLYRHCLFSVFPSLYEGWGLPVVESLALGKPCICSTAPAVAEAAQGFAVALAPDDVPAWTAAVERLWLDDAARNELAARCTRDFHAQTWHEHATRLLEVAQGVAR